MKLEETLLLPNTTLQRTQGVTLKGYPCVNSTDVDHHGVGAEFERTYMITNSKSKFNPSDVYKVLATVQIA